MHPQIARKRHKVISTFKSPLGQTRPPAQLKHITLMPLSQIRRVLDLRDTEGKLHSPHYSYRTHSSIKHTRASILRTILIQGLTLQSVFRLAHSELFVSYHHCGNLNENCQRTGACAFYCMSAKTLEKKL